MNRLHLTVVVAVVLLAGCSTGATEPSTPHTSTPTVTETTTPLPDTLVVTFSLNCRTADCYKFAEGQTYLEIRRPTQNSTGNTTWKTVHNGTIDDLEEVPLDTDIRYLIVLHGNEDSFAWRTDGTRVLGTFQPRKEHVELVVAPCCHDP